MTDNTCSGCADDSGTAAAEGAGAEGDTVARSRPAKEPKPNTSPSATLESSFEALNVKKFDLTFAMDPLFRRTSAQFDEGGAKGENSSHLGLKYPSRFIDDSWSKEEKIHQY